MIFSPDSRHYAYVAVRKEKSVVVLDGVEGKEYDGFPVLLDPTVPTFSPDSKHLAGWARRGDRWLMVVDGIEGNEYDFGPQIGPMTFSSPGTLNTIAVRGDEVLRVEVKIVEKRP